jgi:hypothetical protein
MEFFIHVLSQISPESRFEFPLSFNTSAYSTNTVPLQENDVPLQDEKYELCAIGMHAGLATHYYGLMLDLLAPFPIWLIFDDKFVTPFTHTLESLFTANSSNARPFSLMNVKSSLIQSALKPLLVSELPNINSPLFLSSNSTVQPVATLDSSYETSLSLINQLMKLNTIDSNAYAEKQLLSRIRYIFFFVLKRVCLCVCVCAHTSMVSMCVYLVASVGFYIYIAYAYFHM